MLALLFALASASPCTYVSGDLRASGPRVDWLLAVEGVVAATSASPTLPEGVTGTSGDFAYRGRPCAVADTHDAIVTPGLIAVGTQLGLVEVEMVDSTNQADAGGEHPVRASLVAVDAYNPLSSVVPVTRVGGVTHAVVFPSGGMISGQAGVVRLSGQTQAESVVDRAVAVVAHRSGHIGSFVRELRLLLDDARFARRERAAVDRNAARALAAHPRDLLALGPLLDGEVPLVVGMDKASDIEAMLAFAKEQQIRLVIHGGAEAWRHATALAEARVAVVVNPVVFGPGSFDQLDGRPDNATVLAAAGVDVILGGLETHNARLVAHMAGIAVGQGMWPNDALAAVTSTPARVFGQPGGDFSVGSPASFVVWRSVTDAIPTDPFEVTTAAVAVYVDGVEQPLTTRQTLLRDRYRDLPGSPLSPLRP